MVYMDNMIRLERERYDNREDAKDRLYALSDALVAMGVGRRYGVRMESVKVRIHGRMLWHWQLFMEDKDPGKPVPKVLEKFLRGRGIREDAAS